MTVAMASFRDPSGRCLLFQGRVLRVVTPQCAAECEAFLQTAAGRDRVAKRDIIGTRRLGDAEWHALRGHPQVGVILAAMPGCVVFEHERIPFASYPHEWSPAMLWEAGRLTLDLALAALKEGYALKDASPYNVLFRGSAPVFVDIASFEPRVPGDSLWLPYAQFVRTFLLPLLAYRHWGLTPPAIFATRRDGLDPSEARRFCGPFGWLNPRLLSWVFLPTWLAPKARRQGHDLYRPRRVSNPEQAQYIVETVLRQLRRAIEAVKPPTRRESGWSTYMETHSYGEPGFDAKEQFVSEILSEFRPRRLLDVGANDGHFSVLSARFGASVVAVDQDPVCSERLWVKASAERLDLLPLLMDFARPSPALGWLNAECSSFLERAQGAFDGVLMLAVLHHLLVTERIPLEQVLRLAAELPTSLLLIEFVAPDDPMFRVLLRGRDALHAGLNRAAFEQACALHFEIVRSVDLPGTRRRVYALKRRDV